MERNQAFKKVLAILSESEFSIDGITEATKLDGYIDSLDACEISVQIEKNLDVTIDDFPEEKWKTVGDIVDTYIENATRVI